MLRAFAALVFSLVGFFYSTSQAQNLNLNFSGACAHKQSQIILAFAGDFLVHDMLYKHAVRSPERFYSLVKKTAPLFAKADLSYANLEGPAALGVDASGRDHGDIGFVYDLKVYSGTNLSFNYHPSIIGDLHKLGLNIVSTSNNHSLDRASLGIDKTILAFRAQNDIAFVGTRLANEPLAPLYTLTRKQDFNIAWVSCTESTNGYRDRRQQLFYCYQNANEITALIQELSKRSDIDAVIVTPHWGEEYSAKPNASQKTYARRFLEAGATAIIGAHPHVLQPWEKYTTADGRETLIVYSLGNFLAFQARLEKKASAIIYLGLGKRSFGKPWIFATAFTPTYRDGVEVFPTRSNEVVSHVTKFYGTQALRFADQPLWSSCPND